MVWDGIKNRMKEYRYYIVFILGSALCYCWLNNWTYYFFDIIIKFVSGIGTIIAGLFVYEKWQDEKTRNLYERSLQQVYAPLMGVLIRQETYRQIEHPDIKIKDVPILSITTQHNTFKFSSDGLNVNNYTEKKDGLVSNRHFLTVLNGSEEAFGLMSPTLLKYTKSYSLLLSLEEEKKTSILSIYPEFTSNESQYDEAMASENGMVLQNVAKKRCEIEKLLIHEIADRYNECVEKLGMYNDKVKILDE